MSKCQECTSKQCPKFCFIKEKAKELYEMYVIKGMTIPEISHEFKKSNETITEALKENGIAIRPRGWQKGEKRPTDYIAKIRMQPVKTYRYSKRPEEEKATFRNLIRWIVRGKEAAPAAPGIKIIDAALEMVLYGDPVGVITQGRVETLSKRPPAKMKGH